MSIKSLFRINCSNNPNLLNTKLIETIIKDSDLCNEFCWNWCTGNTSISFIVLSKDYRIRFTGAIGNNYFAEFSELINMVNKGSYGTHSTVTGIMRAFMEMNKLKEHLVIWMHEECVKCTIHSISETDVCRIVDEIW